MKHVYPLVDPHTVKALGGNQYRVDWDVGPFRHDLVVGSEIVDMDGIDIVSDEFFDAHSDVLPDYVFAPQHYEGDIAWLCVARSTLIQNKGAESRLHELIREHL